MIAGDDEEYTDAFRQLWNFDKLIRNESKAIKKCMDFLFMLLAVNVVVPIKLLN